MILNLQFCIGANYLLPYGPRSQPNQEVNQTKKSNEDFRSSYLSPKLRKLKKVYL